jgi:hypothetical protein
MLNSFEEQAISGHAITTVAMCALDLTWAYLNGLSIRVDSASGGLKHVLDKISQHDKEARDA